MSEDVMVLDPLLVRWGQGCICDAPRQNISAVIRKCWTGKDGPLVRERQAPLSVCAPGMGTGNLHPQEHILADCKK